jgi:hypothetical protein
MRGDFSVPGIGVTGGCWDGGMSSLYASFGSVVSEPAALAAARSRGIVLEGVGGSTPALVVGHANLAEASVVAAVKALAASLRDA